MKFLKKTLKRLVTLAVLATVGYYGWNYYQATQAAEEEAGLGEIPTEAVSIQDITVSVSATGTLGAVRIVDVKSKAAGEILSMPVELGDKVEVGELLAQIDVETLEQEMAQARADLDSAQIRYDVTERQYQRAQDLQKQDLVSFQDLDTAEQNYTQARAQLLRAQAEIKLRDERLEDATVVAPSRGTIISKTVEEGTIIQSSINSVQGGTTLVQMADLSTLEVRTLVDEIDIGRVKAGLPVEITVEAFPERKFQGEVIKIEPQAVLQQQVTTFPVLSRIDNTDGLLFLGMNANVDIIIHRRPRVLSVPNEGVRSVADAGQVAELLGLPFDREALQQGGRADMTSNEPPPRGAAFADTPRPEGQRPGGQRPGGQRPGGQRPEGEGGRPGSDDQAEGEGQAAETAEGAEGESADPAEKPVTELTLEEIQERMRGMPRSEMGEFMQKLTDKQRSELRASFAARFGGGGAGGGRPGGGSGGGASMDAFGVGRDPQPGVVFTIDEAGVLTARMVMTGVQDWENTEIVSGLSAGEEVVVLPSTSLLMSQQALRDRFSRFAGGGIPGTSSRGRR